MESLLFQDKKEEFVRYLKELWKDSKPLIKLFRTESRGYLYDTGTNRIFACNEAEFTLLDNLMKMEIGEALDLTASSCPPDEFFETIDGIPTVIEEKNILKTKKACQFGLSSHYRNLEESIRNNLRMIQLEITERCNLRCLYCLYSPHFTEKRDYGTRDMDVDIAYRAIEYLARCSRYNEEVAVAFYGGEPLMRFPLIQSCVQHARHAITGKNLWFSITTNATLLTPEMAEYFAREGFGVHVSIDGPEDIHDQYRKDTKSIGSFRKTISGLKMLLDAYGDRNQKITLSMVYSPPYSKEKVSRMAELWNEFSFLPIDMPLSISYAQGFLPHIEDIQSRNGIDFSLFEWAKDKFIEGYKKGTRPHPIALNFIEKRLAPLVKRQIFAMPLNKYHLNGCCIPGVRKLFVSVDGTLFVCERVGRAPNIGNILEGVNTQRVYNIYVKEYEKESLPYCSECWALQLCSICYLHTFYQDKIDLEMKKENCLGEFLMTLEFLKLYCSLLEINNSGLDYLLNWQIR